MSKVNWAVVPESIIVLTVLLTSKPLIKLFVVSLVILFFKSFVTTSPIGKFFAKDDASGGLSLTLSRSYCGYMLTIFWLYLSSENSSDGSIALLFAFRTNKWYTPSCTFSIYGVITSDRYTNKFSLLSFLEILGNWLSLVPVVLLNVPGECPTPSTSIFETWNSLLLILSVTKKVPLYALSSTPLGLREHLTFFIITCSSLLMLCGLSVLIKIFFSPLLKLATDINLVLRLNSTSLGSISSSVKSLFEETFVELESCNTNPSPGSFPFFDSLGTTYLNL